MSAVVRVQPAVDSWTGVRELVRTYGFGPLVPNTVLVGAPTGNDTLAFGSLVMDLARLHRNLVAIREPRSSDFDAGGESPIRIDVWWRGQNANGAFMLALACLVQRGARSRKTQLRLCQIVGKGESVSASTRVLEEFSRKARIEAEVLVVEGDGRTFAEQISEVSADADAACIGLRRPRADESAEECWTYFRTLRDSTASLALVAFAFASEDVKFKRIFRN